MLKLILLLALACGCVDAQTNATQFMQDYHYEGCKKMCAPRLVKVAAYGHCECTPEMLRLCGADAVAR